MGSNLGLFKPVVYEEFSDESGMEEIKQEFLDSLKQCEDHIVGSEQVGESIEFYDEDGAVLLVTYIDTELSRAKFEFVLSEKVFEIGLNNIPEQFMIE